LASREAGLDTETLVRAARAKIRVVSIDERESAFGTGARAVLNLGHTVGHAIEAHGRYERFVHGEAVAMGLVAELAATTRLGLTAPGVLEATRQALARYRLPVSAERSLVEAALHHVWSDKKRVGKTVSLPVVHGLGRWSIEQVDLDTLREAVLG
jgi:3-dehydroquinate synthetase